MAQMAVADRLSEKESDQPACRPGEESPVDFRRQRTAVSEDEGNCGNGPDVEGASNECSFSLVDQLGRYIRRPMRNSPIILKLGNCPVYVTKLFLDPFVRCDDAQLGAVETGAHQFVDGILEIGGSFKNRDRFHKCGGIHSHVHTMPPEKAMLCIF